MLREVKWCIWSLILLTFFASCLEAQDYVYANNDILNGANSVSAYSVGANGMLSQITGSPFLTGGSGTSSTALTPYAANRVIVMNHFLYASNAGSHTVSAFNIDLNNNGVLVPIGLPVLTQGQDNSSNSGISLAATPDGKYLYAGTTDGTITIFDINSSTGGLTAAGSVSADGPMYSMKVSPNGKFLFLPVYSPASSSTDPYGLDVFGIQSDGTLQPAAGSPVMFSSVAVTSVDINCAGTLLFAGRAAVPDIDVFSIGTNGTLTELSGSPFSTSSGSYQVVALSKDDITLFASNPGAHTVTAFPVLLGVAGFPDGTLNVASATSAAAAGTSGQTVFTGPGGLAVTDDGTFLFAADTSVTGAVGAISTYSLNGSTPLTFDSLTYPIPDPYPTGLISRLQSLAAYPSKACAPPPPSNTLTAGLEIFTAPPLGFDLEATLMLDSSLIVDPLTQLVTIQIGSFTFTLPPGSLRLFQNGKKAGTYVSNAPVDNTHLKVQITLLGQNQFQISAQDKKDDLTSLAGPVTVTVGIGGNSASVSITPSFGSRLHGKAGHPVIVEVHGRQPGSQQSRASPRPQRAMD